MPSFDQTIIQSVVANAEATINKFVRNSVGMGIRQLIANYDKKLNKSVSYEKDPAKFLSNNFQFDPASLNEPKDVAAMQYLLEQAKSPINQFDYVTLHLPSLDSNTPDIEQCYPLALVLPLVWLALKDHERYQHNYYPADKALNELSQADKNKAFNAARKDYPNRLATLYSCVRKLHSDQLCHLGIRHELMFTLNKTYQGLDFIEDARASVRDLLRGKLTTYFHQYYANSKTESLASLYEWMRGSNAKNFIGKVDPNGEIKQFLQAFIVSHGSRADQELDDMLDQALATLTFENDTQYPILSTVNNIFNFPVDEDSNSTRDKALIVFQAWLLETFDLNNLEHEEVVIRFNAVYSANENLKKYAVLLRVSGKFFEMLEQNSSIYFNDIQGGNFSSDNGITGAANAFEQELRNCKAATKNDEVENFFAKWFHKDTSRASKRFLYSMLFDTYTVEKIIFKNDAEITNFKNNLPVDDANAKQVTPYEINRVILHGILVEPMHWTESFKELFAAVLALFKDFHQGVPSVSHLSLQVSSYPEKLISQLRYLLDDANGGDISPRPSRVIVLPHQINCAEDWFALADFLEPEELSLIYTSKRVVIEKTLIEKFQRHSKDPAQVSAILNSIPEEYRLDFLKLQQSIKRLIGSRSILCSVLSQLTTQDQWTFLTDILTIDFVKHLFTNRNDLGYIVDSLQPENQLAFLTHTSIMGYFKCSYDIAAIVGHVASEYQLAFLVETLVLNFAILKNSYDLGLILGLLKPENQIPFLTDTLTLNYVKTLIKTMDDLVDIGRNISSPDNRVDFLTQTFTLRFVKSYIIDNRSMLNVINLLSPNQQLPFIINHLTVDFAKTFIKNSGDLAYMLHVMGAENQSDLINTLTLSYVKAFIKNPNDIAAMVFHLEDENQLAFLTDTLTMDFVKTFIKNSKDVAFILRKLDPENQLPFMNNALTMEFVKTYLKTNDDLLVILGSLKPENQLLFLRDPLIIDFTKSVVKHDSTLGFVLQLALESENVKLLPLATDVAIVRNNLSVDIILRSHLPNTFLTNFIKTYNALRDGQNSYFKTDWVKSNILGNDDALYLIIKHALESPNSRTAKAFELTMKYKNEPNSNKLLTDIYDYSFARSGFGIFRQSRIANTSIFSHASLQKQISQKDNKEIDFNNAPTGSRRHKILTAMGGG